MRELLLATSFLTILPGYGNRVASEDEMAQSLYFYPLVGLFIGLFLAASAYLGMHLNLGWAGDVLIIFLWIIACGGLHLDGLMDSADGIFSGRERERKLEIMKDSRIGAMGGIALVMQILLKVSFLGLIPYPLKYGLLLIAPALGRTMMIYPITYFPYARPGPGLGKSFGDKVSQWVFPATMILVMIVSYGAGGMHLTIFAMVAALMAGLAARWIASILGGHTGDTYGAVCEISETILMIVAAVGYRILNIG